MFYVIGAIEYIIGNFFFEKCLNAPEDKKLIAKAAEGINPAAKHHCSLFWMIGIACFISGGPATASVLVYDVDDLYGDPIETSMVNSREDHACTIFQSVLHQGRPVAIVAGGYLYPNVLTTAELWDFTQEGTSWVSSKIIFTSDMYCFFQKLTIKCFRVFDY